MNKIYDEAFERLVRENKELKTTIKILVSMIRNMEFDNKEVKDIETYRGYEITPGGSGGAPLK